MERMNSPSLRKWSIIDQYIVVASNTCTCTTLSPWVNNKTSIRIRFRFPPILDYFFKITDLSFFCLRWQTAMVIHHEKYWTQSVRPNIRLIFIYKLSSGLFVRQHARTCHSSRSFNLYVNKCAHSNSCEWLMPIWSSKHQFAFAYNSDFDLI